MSGDVVIFQGPVHGEWENTTFAGMGQVIYIAPLKALARERMEAPAFVDAAFFGDAECSKFTSSQSIEKLISNHILRGLSLTFESI